MSWTSSRYACFLRGRDVYVFNVGWSWSECCGAWVGRTRANGSVNQTWDHLYVRYRSESSVLSNLLNCFKQVVLLLPLNCLDKLC